MATQPNQDNQRDDASDSDAKLRALTRAVTDALDREDRASLLEAIGDAHAADIADIVEQITPAAREGFVQLAAADFPIDVLPELEEGTRDEIAEILDPAYLADAVGELESDDAVYLIENLEEERQRDILDALPIPERRAIERALSYPEDSAGRMMQRDLVAVPPFWTVGQTIDMMRAREDLPDEFYQVIVIDPTFKPIGTVQLSRLMASKRPVKIEAIMADGFRTVDVYESQEDVAYLFNQYHLVTVPVIDDDGRLVGVITIDDAMEALDDEAEEDLLRLGGVGDEDLTDSVIEIATQRLPWLGINLLTAILASVVIAQFDMVIEKIVALAILMTIVASMGGNAGTQTLTVAVRAIATKDLTSTNAWRIITRESLVGVLNGVVFAVVMGAATWAWYGDGALGAVLGVAMIVNMFVAALAGILIPIALDKLGADPALASAVFVTTVTDVVGFFAFLGIAALVLL